MIRTTSVCAALFLACAACGEDAAPDAHPPGSGRDDATAPVSTAGNDAAASAAEAGSSGGGLEASVPDAAEPSNAPDADAGTAPAQKDSGMARPTLDLHIPVASVPCGGSICETLDNVCCESWSKGSGFGTTQSCMTGAMCNQKYARAGEQNRAIPHECDGKEDCSGGQVCCMIAWSMPLCEFGQQLSECLMKLTGPGGSGICADNDKCMLGATQFIAEGVPLGVLACNDDADCVDRPDTKCQPEQSDSLTTGKGVQARSYVKVCR